VAPITGRVGLRLVDPGNTVFSGTGSTLVVITQLAPITVVFNVAEDSLPEIQKQLKGGRKLPVDIYDRSDSKKINSGTLSSVDNQIDTTTGTLKFRAQVSNADYALVPNQFVNARLLVKTLENVVQIPAVAVQQNGTQAFVYLVHPAPAKPANAQNGEGSKESGGKESGAAASGNAAPKGPSVQVTVQNITVLTSNDTVAAVTGLQPGQQVATSGFDRLENNAVATVQQNKAASKATGNHNGVGADSPASGTAGNGASSNAGSDSSAGSGNGTSGSSSSQGSGSGSGSGSGGKGGQ
jgi:membrane fusion protein, multidrug efflux system